MQATLYQPSSLIVNTGTTYYIYALPEQPNFETLATTLMHLYTNNLLIVCRSLSAYSTLNDQPLCLHTFTGNWNSPTIKSWLMEICTQQPQYTYFQLTCLNLIGYKTLYYQFARSIVLKP